ncbi:MAG TPA: 2-oxoglutarate dehydrogenase E1 component [Rhabdochlamydiaceae bacterium]|jgi:2-oxoglutarate dehydrogenase E1 component|nr:2-oxoglutarate dehydrogenase E1 component [Rhabdochlamydiaceae bacterium]
MDEISFSNLAYLEEQYRRYLDNPAVLEGSWRHFFEGWDLAREAAPAGEASSDLKIYHLIEAYRTYGHLKAKDNPLFDPPTEVRELALESLGFKKADLDNLYPTWGFLPEAKAPLSQIIQALEKTYCGAIGVEYMGLRKPELESWLQKIIEPNFTLPFSKDDKLEIFHQLNRAELFETFLHTKYVGQKRFSLEGGETFIPMLTFAIEAAAGEGLHEIVIGMAHRGRLNVLANILNKSYAAIFNEFESHYITDLAEGTGDVKYHKGFIGSLSTKSGEKIAITLAANPSHLEAVDPVVEGQARAKQELKGHETVLPILVHGDASIAGLGVVYETLQLSQLNGYETGGTLHVVINNQIGFTTLPKDGRSTQYCTDIAFTFGAPVFHVNAEKPESCVYAMLLALKIRQKFHCDVFLDLYCYRKYGHNEGDEPAFTQPIENAAIRQKKSIRELYKENLIQEGVIDAAMGEKLETEFKNLLQTALDQVASKSPAVTAPVKEDLFVPLQTAVAAPTLIALAEDFCQVPDGFNIHPKLKRLMEERVAMVKSDPNQPTIDWGMGEHLAYASLLADGVHVRISGQDSRRGTFSHRHAMWVDQIVANKRYFPLSHLKNGKAPFDVFNSPLSEFAVLGFEFGYSLFYPHSLVIWEAQFGDFANGGQIIIDQFIACSEQKWGDRSGITLLLPHGYEGQGPEHSSARIERFLQLSGNDNWQIVNCTTSAQVFHLLRRQTMKKQQSPLVIFTPKALLRNRLALSPLSDFTKGTFEEFIDETNANPKRVIFCSGKIYYDLLTERKRDDIALCRIEQLYPFHREKFQKLVERYKTTQEIYWVQEEHSNMGAWNYIRPILETAFEKPVRYVGRGLSSSTAAGSYALHKKQYDQMIREALE